jgi:quinol monooxygenase YgiN
MYGLIVRLTAASGRRGELIEVLGGEDSHTIAGCLSFIVAEDSADEDVLWITEVWDSESSHQASLELPPSRAGLRALETLVARYERIAVTKPMEKHSHPMHGEVSPRAGHERPNSRD